MGSSILSMNDECTKFEKSFASKQNRKFGVMVNSGSSANLILIQALMNNGKLKKGETVAVSALTWSTNIMPLIQLGLEVVLVDCEIDSLNVSVNNIKETYKEHPNLALLFITNTLGHADEIDKVLEFCNENNIILIEDNCEAVGSAVKGKLLGNYGLASTFSFFVGHHLSTIEGGMVCTDDEQLFNHLVMSRAHGWDRNLNADFQLYLRSLHKIDNFYSKYTFYDLAYNVRPSEINGFIGNIQIKYLDQIVKIREKNFLTIYEHIKEKDDFVKMRFGHMNVISSFAIPIICQSKEVQLKYRERFNKFNIEIRPMIAGNMNKQPFFKKYINHKSALKNASLIHENSFYCGNNPDMTKNEIETIIQALN